MLPLGCSWRAAERHFSVMLPLGCSWRAAERHFSVMLPLGCSWRAAERQLSGMLPVQLSGDAADVSKMPIYSSLLEAFGVFGSLEEYVEHWVCFWNPATKICSKPSPRLRLGTDVRHDMNFGFGYDDRREVTSNGYSLNGTVNWIGASLGESRTKKLQIFSYDLNNDTFRCLSVPEFVPIDFAFLSMGVFNGCLCVSLEKGKTVFVVLALKDVRDERSWSRLVSVSYETLNISPYYYKVRNLCMWGDLLFVAYSNGGASNIIISNLKENKVERTQTYYKKFLYYIFSCHYVPSLILPI
ncbi:uncharacterized protein LOC124834479 [Vigna umbellata]|uniref:uncharacterized protein LOC124834479 n=1 Tax=Vigna umbellata TaxID=87088 RepID=UPI001F5E8577|nr:uncharacterized protein LOC124834479 [Vigna umbellata]